jgi:hypothetical protein
MSEHSTETNCLLNGKKNLTRMRDEISLSDSDMAIVERGIAALNRLLAKCNDETLVQPSRVGRLSKKEPRDSA